jgi:hypothetical protein
MLKFNKKLINRYGIDFFHNLSRDVLIKSFNIMKYLDFY